METKSMARLKKYLWKYRYRYLLGAFFMFLGSGSGMAIPWFFKLAVDSIKRGSADTHKLMVYAGIITVLAIASGIFFFLQRSTIVNLSRRIECDMRDEIFSHLLTLSQDFYKKNKSGDLLSRMNNDLGSIRMFMGFGFITILRTIFMVVLGAILMLKLSTRVFFYFLIPVPIFLVAVKLFMRKIHELWENIQRMLGDITEFAREQISGIRITRAYTREPEIRRGFNDLQWRYFAESMRSVKYFGVFEGFAMSLGGIGELFIIWAGGREVIAGRMTLGALVAYHGYLMMLIWPLFGLGWLLAQWERARASLERVDQILATEPSIKDTGTLQPDDRPGELVFKDVWFGYENSKSVLEGLNLNIKPGEFVGIVGKIGCGKTALAELVPRLWEPQKGEILYNGYPLRVYSLKSLRSRIGFVTQECFLFSRSIRANIEFGENKARGVNIERLIQQVDLEKDIEHFTKGVDQEIGERGITLSGGQKQRVAIARAIAKNPSVLVLDDSFSSIDADTEKNIIETLKALKGKLTIIFITHRFSSLVNADRIVVIDDGKIVESGAHEELLAKGGIYSRLFEEQMAEEQ